MLRVIFDTYNHKLSNTLVGYPYVARLKANEHSMVIDITKSLVKSANILPTLKDHDEGNITTIRQVYSGRYTYKRLHRGDKTEMQQ